MAERKSGEWLKRQLRQRRRELFAQHWRPLVGLTVSFAAVGIAVAFVLSWLSGLMWGAFTAGVWVGGFVVMMYAIFTFVDGEAARLSNGFDGETNTASELRQLRREGWVTVHNIHFEGGDVDHVVVGPGGLLVIETKASSADWRFLISKGVLDEWAKQVERGALRVHHLVKSRAKVAVDAVPVVATWVAGQPAEPWTVGRVTGVRGARIGDFIRDRPAVLDSETRDRVVAVLTDAGEQFDEAIGLARRRGFGRLIYRSV